MNIPYKSPRQRTKTLSNIVLHIQSKINVFNALIRSCFYEDILSGLSLHLVLTNGSAMLDLRTNLPKLEASSCYFKGVLNAFEALSSKICCCVYH